MFKFLHRVSPITSTIIVVVILASSWVVAETTGPTLLPEVAMIGLAKEAKAIDHVWFIDPQTHQRAFVGSAADAQAVMSHFALGISNRDLETIALAGSPVTTTVLGKQLSGMILLQVQAGGRAWYVDRTGQRHGLGTPKEAWEAMQRLAQVINNQDLKPIVISSFSPSWLWAPRGYKSEIVATGFNRPRVLAWDPAKHLVVSEHGAKSRVVALVDGDSDGKFEQQKVLVRDLFNGHGLVFTAGRMYVAKEHWLEYWNYDAEQVQVIGNSKRILALPPGGEHFPGQGHKTRTLVLGNDNHLYLSIGSACDNCTDLNKDDYAVIKRLDLEGQQVETFARGLRNTVFFTQHPVTGTWWGNDMGQDNLGNDLPPDEINQLNFDSDYGWPNCYWDQRPTPSNPNPTNCTLTTSPKFTYPAHSAPLGIRVVPAAFNEGWQNDFLSALHGSTVREDKLEGYRIVHVDTDVSGEPTFMDDAITGFLRPGNVIVGRPVDILFAEDGALYITDDYANVVHRVSKNGEFR